MRILLFVTLGLVCAGQASAEMRKVGDCEKTRISQIGSRLEGEPDSGASVQYANGIFGVSYRRVRGLLQSRVGDDVIVCLISVPQDCPPGDDRGRIYGAINMRTNHKWELPDSSHECGGA